MADDILLLVVCVGLWLGLIWFIWTFKGWNMEHRKIKQCGEILDRNEKKIYYSIVLVGICCIPQTVIAFMIALKTVGVIG